MPHQHVAITAPPVSPFTKQRDFPRQAAQSLYLHSSHLTPLYPAVHQKPSHLPDPEYSHQATPVSAVSPSSVASHKLLRQAVQSLFAPQPTPTPETVSTPSHHAAKPRSSSPDLRHQTAQCTSPPHARQAFEPPRTLAPSAYQHCLDKQQLTQHGHGANPAPRNAAKIRSGQELRRYHAAQRTS